MKVREVEPEIDAGVLLAGAQFVDAYSVTVDGTALDSRHAAEKMLARGPQWIDALIRWRNRLVAPFGLKRPAPTGAVSAAAIGIFPVLSESPDRLVAGLNDKHLDFRVVIDVVSAGADGLVFAVGPKNRYGLRGAAGHICY